MTKSQSMPCPVNPLPPDPFPELSRHKMRLYRFQDMDGTGERTSMSVTSELGRTSPGGMLSTDSSDLSVADTASTMDNVTQVLLSLSDTVITIPVTYLLTYLYLQLGIRFYAYSHRKCLESLCFAFTRPLTHFAMHHFCSYCRN